MANLYKADGTVIAVSPYSKKGQWTLDELQAFVGGSIELMPGIKAKVVMNDEAALRGLPFNAKASALVLELLEGKALRYTPKLRGDVLVLTPGEKL